MFDECDHLVFSMQQNISIYIDQKNNISIYLFAMHEVPIQVKIKNEEKLTHVGLGKYPSTKSTTYI